MHAPIHVDFHQLGGPYLGPQSKGRAHKPVELEFAEIPEQWGAERLLLPVIFFSLL